MPEVTEKELEDYLFSFNAEEIPIDVNGRAFRQIKIGSYGVIDLLYVDLEPGCSHWPKLHLNIVELKKDIIDHAALEQICRYKRGLERFIEEKIASNFQGKKKSHGLHIHIKGTLIGSGYPSNSDICFVIDSMDWLNCYHYNLNLETGISFEESYGWCHSPETLTITDVLIQEVWSNCKDWYKHQRRMEVTKVTKKNQDLKVVE